MAALQLIRYKAIARVGVRAEAGFDSVVVGALEVGEIISVLEQANQSARFARKTGRPPPRAPRAPRAPAPSRSRVAKAAVRAADGGLGWVSLTNALRPLSPVGVGHVVR